MWILRVQIGLSTIEEQACYYSFRPSSLFHKSQLSFLSFVARCPPPATDLLTMMPLQVRKKSILKNSTSTPVVYSDGTLMATGATGLANADWGDFSNTGPPVNSYDKIMQMATLYGNGALSQGRKKLMDMTDQVPTQAPMPSRSKLNDTAFGDTFSVISVRTGEPTKDPNTVLNLDDLVGETDLNKLRKKDAFMYHSLPGATHASLTASEYNIPTMKRNATIGVGLKRQAKVNQNQISARFDLNPRFELKRATGSSGSSDVRRTTSDSFLQVKRQTRISYEAHFDVLFQDMAQELSQIKEKRESVLSVQSDDDDDSFYESFAGLEGLPSPTDS
jgi:hypothetical protein